jgi:chemotaxis protein methyltransferase CheR
MKNVWHSNFSYKHSEPVRIWCAASSSGEEPYSISITMQELIGDKYKYELLATDISTKVLKIAMKGVYPDKAVENLDKSKIKKFFQQGKGNAAGYVKVKPCIQTPVKFDKLNLIEPFVHKQNFDMVFCRNVMIYFDNPTKEKIVNRFYDYMNKGAYLMIGHSESLNGLKHNFQYVQPATYRKV